LILWIRRKKNNHYLECLNINYETVLDKKKKKKDDEQKVKKEKKKKDSKDSVKKRSNH